jgi:hypothetical protein
MSGRAVFLWVVVPFVGLSALALWLTRDEGGSSRVGPALALPAEPLSEASPLPPPSVEVPPLRGHDMPVLPSLRGAQALRPSPPDDGEPLPEPPPGSTLSREDLRAALHAVRPLVRQCFLDVAARYPGPQTVSLRFTLEAHDRQGRFTGGEVVEGTVQDPFVLACLLESLVDAQFSTVRETGQATLTWAFRSPSLDDGG